MTRTQKTLVFLSELEGTLQANGHLFTTYGQWIFLPRKLTFQNEEKNCICKSETVKTQFLILGC